VSIRRLWVSIGEFLVSSANSDDGAGGHSGSRSRPKRRLKT